jgi:hypothetical protein
LQSFNGHFPRHHNYPTTLFDDMEDKTGSPLLDLPAEIRNRVYEHVVPDVPLRYPRSNYVGLVYSSKQLRSELEPIVITKTVAWLEVITESCFRDFNDIFTFTRPQTLHDLENLKVTRPNQLRKDPANSSYAAQAQASPHQPVFVPTI